MTEKQSQNCNTPSNAESNEKPGDLLGVLHDYHVSSPTLNYSFFSGEQMPHPRPATADNIGIKPTETVSQSSYVPFNHELLSSSSEPQLELRRADQYQWQHEELNYSDLSPQLAQATCTAQSQPIAQPLAAPAEPEPETQPQSYEQAATADSGKTQQSAASDNQFNFSPGFNFHDSLLKIFWRIDVDRSNRIDQRELDRAARGRWFEGDEDSLVRLLLYHYDSLIPSRALTDGGISIGQILEHELFRDLASAHAQRLSNQSRERSQKPTKSQRPKLPNLLGRRY